MKIKLLSLITSLFLIFSINAKAGLEEGESALKNRDFATAKEELQPLADKGNPAAQNLIGWIYINGLGVAKDNAKAIEWYKKAAAQGNKAAIYHLAVIDSKARAQQQKIIDEANGYKLISLTDFKLDAKSMKKGTKVLMQGYLEFEGEMISLADAPQIRAQLPNAKVYLLTENSPREARKKLLEFHQKSCGYLSDVSACISIVLGHAEKCIQTFAGTKIRDTYCFAVDEVRTEP